MNKTEIGNLIDVLKLNYPNFARDTSRQIQLWSVYLKDVDYASGQQAVREIIATSKYPPSIAELLGVIEPKQPVLEDSMQRALAYELAIQGTPEWETYCHRSSALCRGEDMDSPTEFELIRAQKLREVKQAKERLKQDE